MAKAGSGPSEGPTIISSVARAMTILDCVASSNRPLSAKAIARAALLTLGTTYNLLRTLVQSGYLMQEQDGYVLGPAFPAMAPPGEGVLLANCRSVLNGLRDELRTAAYLARYKEGEIEIVDIVDGPFAPRVNLWVGVQESAHATAFGKQILAGLDDDQQKDYLARHPLIELTPHTIRTNHEMLRVLSRESKGMVDDQEYALGFKCLAVPVVVGAWSGALAISLPVGTSGRFPECIGSLVKAANVLELAMGVSTGGSGSATA